MKKDNKEFEDVSLDKSNITMMESLLIKDITDETSTIIYSENTAKITKNVINEEK